MQLAETLYDHNANKQPAGHIGLYVSDVISLANLPLSYCRPSAAERDASVLRYVLLLSVPYLGLVRLISTREPQIILTYDQLRDAFFKALAVHRGEARLEDFAQETLFEEMAEKKEEMKKMAEENRELAEEMKKMAEENCELAEEMKKMAEERRKTDLV